MTDPYRAPPALVGSHVGNYVVESLLGEGGMGEVYLARHPELGREVAVKVLGGTLSADATAIGRFRQEAMAACRIGHDAIVEILDIGQMADGRHYYVMEHLRGQSLHDYLMETGAQPPQTCLEILRPVLAALTAAHAVGIVHRDIKPDNIFMARKRDGSLQVKVLDFGIAKLVNTTVPPLVATRTGALIGTPLYMSPEQCAGTGDIGPATDIYAVGAVLFNLLTGRPPFIGEGVGEVLVQHMQTPAPSVRAFRPELSEQLDAVLQTTLAKNAEERFQSVAALAAALETALSGGQTQGAVAQQTPAEATVRLADSATLLAPDSAADVGQVPRALSQTSLSGAAVEHVPLPEAATTAVVSPSGHRTVMIIAVMVGLLIGAGAVVTGVLVGRPPKGSTSGTGQKPGAGATLVAPDAGASRSRPRPGSATAMAATLPRPGHAAPRPAPTSILLPAPGMALTIPLVRNPAAAAPPGDTAGPTSPNGMQLGMARKWLAEAHKAQNRGLCMEAVIKARMSYRYLKTLTAIRIIGSCACQLGGRLNDRYARWAFGLLPNADKEALMISCARRAIHLR